MTSLSEKKRGGYRGLLKTIEAVNGGMLSRTAILVNQALVIRNWLIGFHIVEFEQNGLDRAKYGDRLLERLAGDLRKRGIKGLDARGLRDCRGLFRIYPQIRGSLPPEFASLPRPVPIRGSAIPESASPRHLTSRSAGPLRSPAPLRTEIVLRFSWTHLAELIRLEDPWKRAFYENECLQGNWSVRQLQRQIETLLYERTGLSADKRRVIARGRLQAKEAPGGNARDLIRDPYILEFTGLAERDEYSANDLETALLNHLQRFLLELGAGFCFEARQFRISLNNRHDRVDLVFYHRLLRCHVLVDLKIRAFRHTDAGQMHFYLNWFKAHRMTEGDNPPVGILLCSDKDQTVVEFATAGLDNKAFVSRYRTALPSAEQLIRLVEADRARLTRELEKTR